MTEKELLEILEALFVTEYFPHSEQVIDHLDREPESGRFYAVHKDSNLISLFIPVEKLIADLEI